MPEPALPSSQRLRARNRRQAMDWSLVLASQGIDHVIEQPEEGGWALCVAPADHEAALAVIRLYRLENRHWRWRRPVFQPDLFFDWRSITWVMLTIVFFAWSGTRDDLRRLGGMDGSVPVSAEWWRLFTATLLHADLAHLMMNAAFGFVLLGLAMGRYGPGVGLLAAFLAGAAGNAVARSFYGPHQQGLGASGVVMGALGLLTVQSVVLLRQRNPNAPRLVAAALLGGVLLFVLLGLSPGTDKVAHLGGFVAGAVFGFLLAPLPRLPHRSRSNLTAGLLFLLMLALTWWLAMTAASPVAGRP